MRTSTLIRWGGLAALVASIISIAIEIALLAVLSIPTSLGKRRFSHAKAVN